MKVKTYLKNYEELWSKVKDLIRSKINNSDNYNWKYTKIKFTSDDDLPLKKNRCFSRRQQILSTDFLKRMFV